MQAKRSDLNDDFYEMERPAFWSQPHPSVSVPFHGFDHVELVTEHGDAVGGDYVAWLRERVEKPEALIGSENQLPHDYVCPQAVRTAVPEEYYHTAYITERASAWLEGRKDNDTPFFLMVSWPDPHHPFNPPGKYWDMYSPEDMPEPIGFEDAWQPPLHVRKAEEARAAGKAALKGMGTIACTKQEAMEARALTCGMISMIDDGVGKVCSSLENIGREKETVRIFTSDHGDHLGDHRILFKGSEQYDAITRVPFIWSDPSGAQNIRTSEIGQTLDIGTTILEAASVEAPIGMQGQALDVAGGKNRDLAFIQYDHQREDAVTKLAARVHTVHDGRWRLSLYHGADYGELYDLVNDPEELSNLWSDPAAEAEKSRLIYALAKLEIASVDRVPLPTGRA